MNENLHTSSHLNEYDDLLWQHLKTLPAFRALLRAIEARFYHQIDFPEPILDLGCGDGDFASHTFNEYGRRVNVGLDPWLPPLTHSVEKRVYDLALQAAGAEMPFPSNHFKSAFSNSVLEHIPDIQPVLNETGRVLAPDGLFLMTSPNHRFTEMLGGALFFERFGLQGLGERYRTFFNKISRHAHTEGIEWWAARLAEAGMQVERWQYYFSPAALHTLEIGHIQGGPSAVMRALTGKWIVAPTKANLALTDRWVRPYYLEQSDLEGCYVLIIARKVSDEPLKEVKIPPAQPFPVSPDGDLISDSSTSAENGEPFQVVSPLTEHSGGVVPLSAAVAAAVEGKGEDESDGNAQGAALTENGSPTSGFSFPTLKLEVLLPLIVGLILSFGASVVGGPPTERPMAALFLWLCAIGAGIYGAIQAAPPASEGFSLGTRTISWLGRKWKTGRRALITAAILFGVGWGIRLFQLGDHPFILSGTEAGIGLEAIRVASGEWGNPFSAGLLQNPVLPFYPIGMTLNLFGRSATALRFFSTLVGGLSIPLVYLLGRRLWGEAAGVAAAVILLGNHTFLHYSRLGLTNIWDPFFVLLTFAALLAAWRKEQPLRWIPVGLLAGLSAYLFTASRLLPLILMLTLGIGLAFDFKRFWGHLRGILLAAALALIVALPMMRFYGANPGLFNQRLNTFGVIQSGWIENETLLTNRPTSSIWTDQIWKGIGALVNGDDRSTYYGPERGLLNLGSAILFFVGFGFSLIRLNRPAYVGIIGGVLITAIAGGVLMVDTPASHRYLVALPFAALLAGYGTEILVSRLLPAAGSLGRFALPAALLISLLMVGGDIFYYFTTYREAPSFADQNTETAHEIAEFLNSLAASSGNEQLPNIFLHGAPFVYANFPNIDFLAPQFSEAGRIQNVENLDSLDGITVAPDSIFIILNERIDELNTVENRYPGGETFMRAGQYKETLYVVYRLGE